MSDQIRNASRSEIRDALADPSIQIGLYGPPGVGKTFDLFQWANRPAAADPTPGTRTSKRKGKTSNLVAAADASIPPRYVGKVQFHSEIAPAEVMGMYVPDGDKFKWEAGPGDLAYSKGGLLILDEIDQASGPMKSYLMGLLDRGPGGTISYVGRNFEQASGYQAVATMNDQPDNGVLPEALLDRFDAWFLVDKPSPEQLLVLDYDLRQICEDSYASATDPLKGPPITFRLLMGVQKLRKRMPTDQAILGACKNNSVLARSLSEVLKFTDPEPTGDDEGEEDA